MGAILGGLLGSGAVKIKSSGTPTTPEAPKVAQQSDLDRQRQAAAGASPSTSTGAGFSALTQGPDQNKKMLQGF